jgi:hypothetical protein
VDNTVPYGDKVPRKGLPARIKYKTGMVRPCDAAKYRVGWGNALGVASAFAMGLRGVYV